MYQSYPAAADLSTYLSAYLTSLGLAIPPALDLSAKVAAAIADFESRVGWYPYLCNGTPYARRFDPPGPAASSGRTASFRGGKHLELHAGLLDVTSPGMGVAIGVINLADGSNAEPVNAGTLLQFNVQYFCRPDNAIERGLSWTEIEFFTPQLGVPKSIQVTGLWGRVRTLPADVWEGILEYAAYLCRPELATLIGRARVAVKMDDFSYQFSQSGPLSSESAQWLAGYKAMCRMKRRVTV